MKERTESLEERKKRLNIWYHNGLKGSAKMILTLCQSMINASTTTTEAKDLAHRISILAKELEQALVERVEGKV